MTRKYQLAASVSTFKPLSVELSNAFTTFGRYLQQRLWTPLIFLGASANGKPARIWNQATLLSVYNNYNNRFRAYDIIIRLIILYGHHGKFICKNSERYS